MTTKTIITNLKTLLAAVQVQPEENFDLGYFRTDADIDGNACGTLFCTVGLATTLPLFQELGYEMRMEQWRTRKTYWVEKNGVEIIDNDITDAEFGPGAYAGLFVPTNYMGTDSERFGYIQSVRDWDDKKEVYVTVTPASHTDKELAILRLEARIAEYEAAQ